MSSRIRISTRAVKLLEARGMIPLGCAKLEIHIPPHGPMVLRYEVFVNSDRMRDLSEAFALMADGPDHNDDE